MLIWQNQWWYRCERALHLALLWVFYVTCSMSHACKELYNIDSIITLQEKKLTSDCLQNSLIRRKWTASGGIGSQILLTLSHLSCWMNTQAYFKMATWEESLASNQQRHKAQSYWSSEWGIWYYNIDLVLSQK